ncbi:hypothetical protein F4859DRAFT_467070 [Xylaria cf. heliscus]|nr:hypothetical protein F4859DRAFT_467070 [Xylaria cf. heliscus]
MQQQSSLPHDISSSKTKSTMSQEKAIQLLRLTHYMCIAPTLLHFDEDASRVAIAMYRILKNEFKWEWPNKDKHLEAWDDNRGECTQQQGESDEDHQARAEVWHEWPSFKTTAQAQWLGCAIITSRALEYLYQCHTQGQCPRIYSARWGKYGFEPQDFYKYVWICLSQGHGTRIWKTQPPMPSETEQNVEFWFASSAQRLVDETVKAWEAGKDLGDQFPRLGIEDILPSPQDKELLGLKWIPLENNSQ